MDTITELNKKEINSISGGNGYDIAASCIVSGIIGAAIIYLTAYTLSVFYSRDSCGSPTPSARRLIFIR